MTILALLLALTLSTTIEQREVTTVSRIPNFRFAAASVKPVRWQPGQYHGGDCHGIDSKYRAEASTRPTPLGRCIFPNTTLGNIVQFAFHESGKPSLRISSEDKWILSDAFEVQATAENVAETTEEQLRQMLQAFLRDRFKLQVHLGMHEERGFALVRAASDPKLISKNSEVPSGPIFLRRDSAQLMVTGTQVTIESLVNFLSGELQQPIQDETGMDGVYEMVFHFRPADANGSDAAPNNIADPSGPSLFTALQEQLGLRLEPRRVTVETLVIDHVEHPSEN
jgi:uncharacterized protein (TIGR03435 family)